MYLKRIFLKNIRCFDELEINFDQPGSSLVILGDNGDGKSTVLRCLAMGLCDESSASALFRELPGEFVRREKNKKHVEKGVFGEIEIDLLNNKGITYQIKTRITSVETFERVSQYRTLYRIVDQKKELLNQDSFPWEELFVSGYGAGTRTQGTGDYHYYLAVDAVYPLFNYNMPLQNPELAIRRLIEAARSSRKTPAEQKKRANKMLFTIQSLLATILELEKPEHFRITSAGIEIEGNWGRAELGEMGDGYQATVTWVLDLLSWWFLRATKFRGYQINNIHGIVLIDELEQHLHPRWQRYILSLLKKAFRKIQFISTTHSPLCAAGTADLGEDTCQLFRLYQSNGVAKGKPIPLPYGLRADQILTSELFNLPETRNPLLVGEKVSRYYKLLHMPELNRNEKLELNRLRKFISSEVPEAGQFEEERRMRNELRSLIKKIETLKKK